MYPPTRVCIRPGCKYIEGRRKGQQRQLSHRTSTNVVYLSREFGPLPATCHSMSCSKCNDRYYPDFFVDQESHSRAYYGGIPTALHVTTHMFIEAPLCDRWTNSSACAWVSFTNNARIYNLEHQESLATFPRSWSVEPELLPTIASDAFFLFALLRNRMERRTHLVLSNNGDQSARLEPALLARNASMVGPAREKWNHICDKCCSIEEHDGELGFIRATVMDGITIGRPCCKVHDCQEPLPSQRSRFCATHSSKNDDCAVVGCTGKVTAGFQTCQDPSHRTLEDPTNRSSLFVLRRRLERLRTASLEGDGNAVTDELVDIDADGECPSKSDEGNTKPHARFGRWRTHNEQLVVVTCGIILGRATMFGSEGIDGVRKHLNAVGDTYFDNCVMPVDPFHAKTKHKETDMFCAQYCNAAQFPDLLKDGKWRFNSSAAEMTNAWFGGFQAMVREMRECRYDFFLDEMILIRNRIITADLVKARAHPLEVPYEFFGLSV
ncbi:hypothetical protein L226DRAFT_548234 [Lentinus tigrinus ALCF2SS1-7]|uniref:uncharacterized protein n=1 Tax=Lentinus tigrinus ALCF2SS1-7 TaxID=1328758 RepID=UPI00116609CD|nr:hypothetical protein L226DRAFT_548234 [Lentinus tigrinus ALCF2SS1-7]